ncbi:hypothetical protein NLG97_g11402 [Lecanicillium saksenae]|uniref:Uncharacterized protein n=1 Tax=Lecanicillium saksenae TaxID=468837 RepID=A0ACC1QAM8_9HYPO|nr:hypothetical protein NLG97_g11402 [Lecanicillium saksenae]
MSQQDSAHADEHHPAEAAEEKRSSVGSSEGEPTADNDESFEDAVDAVDTVSPSQKSLKKQIPIRIANHRPSPGDCPPPPTSTMST